MKPFTPSQPATRKAAEPETYGPSGSPLPKFWRTKFAYLVTDDCEDAALRTLYAMARAWEGQSGTAAMPKVGFDELAALWGEAAASRMMAAMERAVSGQAPEAE